MDEVKFWLEKHVHRTYNKNTKEYYVMLDMLQKHPTYSTWKNKEIEYFKITRSSKKKYLQVYIKLENIKIPRIVSWIACVTGKKSSNDQLASAMRTAIKSQIAEYSFRHPVKRCSICETYSDIEVDHYPTKFRDLKKSFLDLYPEESKTFFLKDKHILTNKNFEEEWKQYHKRNATYRYLYSRCNQVCH